MNSKTLSKSGIKDLNTEIFQEYGIEPFDKKELVLEIIDSENKLIYLKSDGESRFFYYNESIWIPTLKYLLKQNFLKKITVDMGAIKFITSGADVMRPGIIEVDETIEEGEIISIIDEKNKKPIAVGKSILSGKETINQDKGKSIINIHYIGDNIWNI
jgi:PUA-domain protein